jgi:hypothetical protein
MTGRPGDARSASNLALSSACWSELLRSKVGSVPRYSNARASITP